MERIRTKSSAKTVQDFIRDVGAKTAYITPGSPWENVYVERFNGTLRDELLNREVFYTLTEARAMTEIYRQEYNKTAFFAKLYAF